MTNRALLSILLLPMCLSVFAESTEVDDFLQYVRMEPNFVVNLQGSRRSYLRMDIQLLIEGKERAEKIKTHMPILRHAVIMLTSDYTADQLSTPEQREEFRQKALDESRKALDKHANSQGLSDLYFTEFLVQ